MATPTLDDTHQLLHELAQSQQSMITSINSIQGLLGDVIPIMHEALPEFRAIIADLQRDVQKSSIPETPVSSATLPWQHGFPEDVIQLNGILRQLPDQPDNTIAIEAPTGVYLLDKTDFSDEALARLDNKWDHVCRMTRNEQGEVAQVLVGERAEIAAEPSLTTASSASNPKPRTTLRELRARHGKQLIIPKGDQEIRGVGIAVETLADQTYLVMDTDSERLAVLLDAAQQTRLQEQTAEIGALNVRIALQQGRVRGFAINAPALARPQGTELEGRALPENLSAATAADYEEFSVTSDAPLIKKQLPKDQSSVTGVFKQERLDQQYRFAVIETPDVHYHLRIDTLDGARLNRLRQQKGQTVTLQVKASGEISKINSEPGQLSTVKKKNKPPLKTLREKYGKNLSMARGDQEIIGEGLAIETIDEQNYLIVDTADGPIAVKLSADQYQSIQARSEKVAQLFFRIAIGQGLAKEIAARPRQIDESAMLGREDNPGPKVVEEKMPSATQAKIADAVKKLDTAIDKKPGFDARLKDAKSLAEMGKSLQSPTVGRSTQTTGSALGASLGQAVGKTFSVPKAVLQETLKAASHLKTPLTFRHKTLASRVGDTFPELLNLRKVLRDNIKSYHVADRQQDKQALAMARDGIGQAAQGIMRYLSSSTEDNKADTPKKRELLADIIKLVKKDIHKVTRLGEHKQDNALIDIGKTAAQRIKYFTEKVVKLMSRSLGKSDEPKSEPSQG